MLRGVPGLFSSHTDHFIQLITRQSGNKYNESGRTVTDHMSVLKIDEPGEDGLYRLHQLEVAGNYRSANGGRDLAVVGFDIEVSRKTV